MTATDWEDLGSRVERHREGIRKRGGNPFAMVMSAENIPPTGCAGEWYDDAAYQMPHSAQAVARQIARLCGDDTQVTVPYRSLSDAVQVRDSAKRSRAYAERGVKYLEATGWLKVETVGSKRGARTTFYLLPGEDTSRGRLLKENLSEAA